MTHLREMIKQKWQKYAKLNHWLWVVMALVPLVYLPITRYKINIDDNGSFSIDILAEYYNAPKRDVLLVLALVVLLALLFKRKLDILFKPNDCVDQLLYAFIGWMGLSTLLSSDIVQSLYGSDGRSDGFLTYLVYVLIVLVARRVTLSERLLKGFTLSASIVALIGILQVYGISLLPIGEFGQHTTAAISTMGNRNFFASFVLLCLPIGLYYYMTGGKRYYLLSFSLFFYALIASFTRGVWIGFAAMFILALFKLYPLIDKPLFKRRAGALVIAMLLLSATFQLTTGMGLFGRFGTIFNEVSKVTDQDAHQTMGSYRGFIWQKSLILVTQNPLFGLGPDNMKDSFKTQFFEESLALTPNGIPADKVHNEYLHYAVTSGIPLMLIYLALLWAIEKRTRRVADQRLLYYIAVFGYCIQANFNISVVSVAYIFWAYLGLLLPREDTVLSVE